MAAGGREGGSVEGGREGIYSHALDTYTTQAIIDSKKPPETISAKMTGGTYLCMGWAVFVDLSLSPPSLIFLRTSLSLPLFPSVIVSPAQLRSHEFFDKITRELFYEC